jgi:hypothetical protein
MEVAKMNEINRETLKQVGADKSKEPRAKSQEHGA